MWQMICIGAVALIYSGTLFAQENSTVVEDSSAELPKKYADYLMASNTLSHDRKFAVIYPKRELCSDESENGLRKISEDRCKDYLVALKPFQILTALDTKSPYFEHKSNGGVSAVWSKDESAVLIALDSKWGPGDVFLYEIHDGKLQRSTNLLTKISGLLVPDYKKAKIGRYNSSYGFIMTTDAAELCKFPDPIHVQIRGNATTDPKNNPGEKAWDASVEAVWDIPNAKFISQKVTRLFAGVRK